MLSRKTYIEINLENYLENLRNMGKVSGSKVIPVVKSNAYGCGAVEIAKISETEGVELFAVAFLEEADNLRKNGIKSNILIFNFVCSDYIEKAIDKNYILSIYSIEQIESYLKKSKAVALNLKYHININTGINNLGVNISELDKLASIVRENNLEIDGIYTHFSNADSDEEITKKQYELFEKAANVLKTNGIEFKVKHAANSAGAIFYNKKYGVDYIRSGMALYGIQPSQDKNVNWIKNVITWKSIVSIVREIKCGERINYGKNFMAEKDMIIAVIPVGYGDGYKTGMSNGGYVLINNNRCEIRGVVCMDQITVEVPEGAKISVGNEVILLGGSGKNLITIEESAKIAGTISDDIICSISREIPRIYKK